MEPHPKPRGFFRKGNKYGKGRPPGSLNRPKEYPFFARRQRLGLGAQVPDIGRAHDV